MKHVFVVEAELERDAEEFMRALERVHHFVAGASNVTVTPATNVPQLQAEIPFPGTVVPKQPADVSATGTHMPASNLTSEASPSIPARPLFPKAEPSEMEVTTPTASTKPADSGGPPEVVDYGAGALNLNREILTALMQGAAYRELADWFRDVLVGMPEGVNNVLLTATYD